MAVLYLKYVEAWIPVPIHGVLCLLAYIFWSFAAVLLAPFMFIFRAYKFVETSLIRYRKLGTVFCTVDVPFMHETESNRNFIIGLLHIRGEPEIDNIRKWVSSRLFNGGVDKTYIRLSQRISKYYWSYVWEAERNFNIKEHIIKYKGPTPRTKRDIEKVFENFAAEDIRGEISPWIIKIIPMDNRSSKKSYFLLCKFHHSIGDGFALVGLLSQLADKKPVFVNPSLSSNRKVTFTSNPVKRVFSGILTGPLAMMTLAFSTNFRNPFRAKETPVAKSVSWTAPISLDSVKQVKNKTDSTINDVLMSCLAGAIHRYLSEVKQKKPLDFPIAMTYNSRSMSQKNVENIPLGNHSGGLFLNLPVSVSDPLKRLEKTKSRINKLKRSSHPHLFSFIYFTLIGGLPEIIGRLSTFSVNRHVSLIVSNVPGPTEPLQLLGSPIESIVFSPPLHGDIGMAVSLFSYDKKIRMTVMSDKKIIKDLSLLTKYFEDEINLLENHLLIGD